MSGSAVSLSRVVRCTSSADALWPLLADTDRLNRAAGLSRIEVEPLEHRGAARFLVSTRLGGFRVRYEERPPEFVERERLKFVRLMRGGPVRSIEMQLELQARGDGGTDVTLSLRIAPRWPLIGPVARLNGVRTLRALAREVRWIDVALGIGSALAPTPSASAEGGAFQRAAQALRRAIPPQRIALAEKLLEIVRSGPDPALARIRPFELADAWGAPRREVLSICLQAVIAGLRAEGGHCQLCDITFGLDLDRAVEATFRPPRPVREIDDATFCIGGPARTPHVVAQSVLPGHSTAVLPVPPRSGRMRLFIRGGATASVDVHGDGPRLARAEAGERLSPPAVVVAPGGGIEVRSVSADDSHVKLERVDWIDRAATAAMVSLLPEFRRLFSGEVLAPGVALKVGRTALLFSDLSASTALYGRAGDAPAFRLVRDSFDVLRATIEEHGGAVVKTIGDAVMAAFTSEDGAVRAAVAMQRTFPEFIRRYRYADGVDLKLGVYAGPCFAVTANGVLDYFGQTVNIAARLQAQAEAGDLVLPEELAEAVTAGGSLDGTVITERFTATLKGVEKPLRLVRARARLPDVAGRDREAVA